MEEKTEYSVLLVDDEENIVSSLNRTLRKEPYNVLTATSGKEGLEVIEANDIAVVVSDQRMPEMLGTEFLAKVEEVSPDTTRIMLTGTGDIHTAVEAINSGKVSWYLTKPWNDDEFKVTISEAVGKFQLKRENKRLLKLTQEQNVELTGLNENLEGKVKEKTKMVWDNFFGFIRVFASVLELHEPKLGSDSKNVAALSKSLSEKVGMKPSDVTLVEVAAYLHKLGLIGLPVEILEKRESRLSEEELNLLKAAPELAQDLIAPIGLLNQAGILIRAQREKFDGSGYPDGLKGEEIPLGARVLSVCSYYVKLKNTVIDTLSASDILFLVREGSGTSFDPQVVEALIELLGVTVEEKKVIEVNITDIKPGMVLAEDIFTARGTMLMSKDTKISPTLISKILRFNRVDRVDGAIKVYE